MLTAQGFIITKMAFSFECYEGLSAALVEL